MVAEKYSGKFAKTASAYFRIGLTSEQYTTVNMSKGSSVGAVLRALAFHQCVPGSIPGPGVICGLSLLVLYSAPRGFSPGTPVSPLHKRQHLI